MSPLRWIQSTGPHWTVILEVVTSETITEVGGADGAGDVNLIVAFQGKKTIISDLLPESLL